MTYAENPVLYEMLASASVRKRSYKLLTLAELYLETKNAQAKVQLQIEGAKSNNSTKSSYPSGSQKEHERTNEALDECMDNYFDKLKK